MFLYIYCNNILAFCHGIFHKYFISTMIFLAFVSYLPFSWKLRSSYFFITCSKFNLYWLINGFLSNIRAYLLENAIKNFCPWLLIHFDQFKIIFATTSVLQYWRFSYKLYCLGAKPDELAGYYQHSSNFCHLPYPFRFVRTEKHNVY